MSIGFSGVHLDVVLTNLLHECRASFGLLLAAVADDFVWHPKVGDELFQGFSCVALGLHWVYGGEVEIGSKDLGKLVPIERFVLPIHCVGINDTPYVGPFVHAVGPVSPSKGQKS